MSDAFVEILKRNYTRISVPQDAETALQSRRRPVSVKTLNRCAGTSELVLCVNHVIVICRSPVRQQHQQSHADPEGGAITPLTVRKLIVHQNDHYSSAAFIVLSLPEFRSKDRNGRMSG